mmetsp:Transcript_117286/g.228041  ORF Transcript_117286/g.228041 Transcript_117286/m.228041 type:complete len:312 (+) Transcript_117286:188-1123(+)
MTLAWMPTPAHSIRHEPWVPTLRPLPCSLAMEPTENSSSSSSLHQGSKPFQAPRRIVRDDGSWLNFRRSFQSFYPPFPAEQHRASYSTEDSSSSQEGDATLPVKGSPLRTRRAGWTVDHGEWRPTLSQRPQEQSKERLQGTAPIAVQPKTARALCNVSQQGCGVVPATEVAVVAKVVRSRSLAIPIGGNSRHHRSPPQNELDQDSDTTRSVSSPEQFDLTLNDTDDDEQDFFPADPCSAGQATFRDAASSPPSNNESSCSIRAEQEAAAKISPRHIDACCGEKPKATRPRRTRTWRRGHTGRNVIWIPLQP